MPLRQKTTTAIAEQPVHGMSPASRSRFWVAGEAALKRLGAPTSRIRIVADQRRVDRFCQEPPEFPQGHSRVRLPLIKM
jgi:hypothetical protein